jgi:creatinine amidohydrolase
MPDNRLVRVAELTRDEFAAAMQAGRWLLMPLGSTEQHGPHLPLGTDLLYAEHISLKVAQRVNGLIAPGLPYGICRTMRNFAGTVSLGIETFISLLREILSEYVRHGAGKIALIAGHAEEAQDAAVREAALPLVEADPALLILAIGPYAFLDPIRREADLAGKDGHAGSIETSETLVIAPHLVQADRIPRATRPPLSRFLIEAHPEREFPSGVRGDTAKISPALGQRALDHTVSEIVRVLRNLEAGRPEWGADEHVMRDA